MKSLCRTGLLAALFLVLPTPGTADDGATAKKLLQLSGQQAGVCFHLGCGQAASAGLTAALAEDGNWVVHGLALDEASLARARKAIETRGVAGRAVVAKAASAALPYLPDLANLVVVEDPSALTAPGITREEILRVLAPEGVLCVRENGKWQKTVKPRPTDMDSWPQTYHGADGNMVSIDKLVKFPIGYRWMDGLPTNIAVWSSCRGWVISGGRCYTISRNETENLRDAHRLTDHYLTARDAFNGLPLWKINLKVQYDQAGLTWRNAGALAADEQRVYAPHGNNQAIAADAKTGAIVTTFPTPFPPRRLVLADRTLVVTGWEGSDNTKLEYEGSSLWSTWVPKSQAGSTEGFDAQSGKRLWSLAVPAIQMVAADGVVYLLAQNANPPTERQVIALDLKTGKERWRITHGVYGALPDLQLNCAGPGFLVVAKRKDRAVLVLSPTDGKLLWQIKPAGGLWTPLVDGLLWHGNKKYDPRTGEVKGTLATGVPDQGCTPSVIVGPYITQSRGGGYLEMPQEGKGGAKHLHYSGARGACMEGMVPANGMFYTAQNWCGCMPGQIYGFLGVGPCGSLPTKEEFQKAREVEKGPAFGALPEAPESGDNWPTFRHDPERSGATAGTIPLTLKELWKSPVETPPGAGIVAAAWKARLVSPLTAPVVAGNQVFVAGTDAGVVVALDARSGQKIWTVTLGGRLDTPPTLYRGLCLVGCHDGWLYALRAKDGALAWRVRVAPRDRLLVAHGAVESVWPVVGTVLVHENTVYVTAGRSSGSDGGVALLALDPATGATRWGTVISAEEQPSLARMNDLLRLHAGALAWHHGRLDPKTGKFQPPDPVPSSQGGIMDGIWTSLGDRRSGKAFTIGKPDAKKQITKVSLLAWNDALVVSPTFAMTRAQADATVGPVKGSDHAWRPQFPNQFYQVEAMALCGNAALFVGSFKSPNLAHIPHPEKKPGEPLGFLVVTDLNGKRLADLPLEAAPTHDGLAVAGGKVFVSLQNGKMVCFGE